MVPDPTKILTICDRPGVLETLTAIVRRAWPTVELIHAAGGPRGIALAQAEHPDVILLDIALPGMDGCEICRRLKADDSVGYIPVLFITAQQTGRQDRVRALAAGAEAFLTTPPDEVELTALIRSMVKINVASVQSRDEQARIAALVAQRTVDFQRELAEREHAEEELRHNEERYRQLLESSNDWTWEINKDGVYTYSGLSIRRLLGYEPEEIIGRTPFDFMPPDEAQRVAQLFGAIAARHEPIRALENVNRHKDGRLVILETNAVPVFDRSGELVGYRGMDHSVTERNQNLAALEEEVAARRILFEQSPDGALIVDPQTGRFIEFNTAAHRQLGYSRDEFAQLSLSDIDAMETTEEAKERIASVFRSGKVEFETLQRTKQGEIRNTQITAHIVDVQGRPVYQCIWRDITERKRAEVAIRESEDKYRTLFTEMLDGFALHEIICDEDGEPADYRFVAINPAFERMTDLKTEDILGRTVLEVLPGTERHWIEMCGRVALTGEPVLFENYAAELKRHFQVTVFRPAANQFACIFTDITGHKLAEQRAFELALERERMVLLTKFIEDAAHEFRTPLSIIQANVYLAERLEDPETRRNKLAKIGEQVVGLTRMVDLMAEMVRLEIGPRLVLQPIDLYDLISVVAGEFHSAAALKDLTLHLDLAPDLPSIPADRVQLGIALRELMDNAVRFTQAAGSVTVRTSSDADGVTVEVQDSGPGMATEVLQHIFERFYRQDAAHTLPGFGLGLPLVRKIVELHGGQVEVESQPGTGSVFRIVLPLAMPWQDDQTLATAKPR